MAEETDPPRKHYQLKPREFEAVNPTSRAAAPAPSGPVAPDRGPGEADAGRIDVRDIFQQANGPALATAKPARTQPARPADPNDVHAILRENLERANAAGLNEVKPARKFRRRKRDFVVLLIFGNGFIAVLYSVQLFIGFQVQCLAARMPFEFENLVRTTLANPASYAFPIACMVFFTTAVAWLMFGVMDDY